MEKEAALAALAAAVAGVGVGSEKQANAKSPKAGKENPHAGIAPPIITTPPLPGSAPAIPPSPSRTPFNESTSTLSNTSRSSPSPKGRLTPTSVPVPPLPPSPSASSKPTVGGLHIPPHSAPDQHAHHLTAPSPTTSTPTTGISIPNIFRQRRGDRPSSRPTSSSMPNDSTPPSSFSPPMPIPGSPVVADPGYASGKEKEKEAGSRTSWFRPKRKESTSHGLRANENLGISIPPGSSPNSGGAGPLSASAHAHSEGPHSAGTSFLPDLRHSRSSNIRPTPRSSVAPETFLPPPPSSPGVPPSPTLKRPKTAPGGAGGSLVVPPSPSTPSPSRQSFDRHYGPSNKDKDVPPVPPLPPITAAQSGGQDNGAGVNHYASPTTSTTAPPSRRGSLSKSTFGNVLSRRNHDPPAALNSSTSRPPATPAQPLPPPQQAPPSPVATNFPSNYTLRQPRRVNSVLPISTPNPKSTPASIPTALSTSSSTPSLPPHPTAAAAIPPSQTHPAYYGKHVLSQSTLASTSRPETTYMYPVSGSGAGADPATPSPPQRHSLAPAHLTPNGTSPSSSGKQSPTPGRDRDSRGGYTSDSPQTPSSARSSGGAKLAKRASRKMSLPSTGSFFSGLRNKDKDKNKEDEHSHLMSNGNGNGGSGHRMSRLLSSKDQSLNSAYQTSAPGSTPPPPPPRSAARASAANGFI